MFVVETTMQNAVAILAAIVISLIVYYQWCYLYWHRKNVPFLQPRFPFGNFTNPFLDKNGFGIKLRQIYKEIKAKGWKHAGVYFFTSPVYIVIDPRYIKNILIKDYKYFSDNSTVHHGANILNGTVYNLDDFDWRNLRKELMSQALTTTNIDTILKTLTNCHPVLLEREKQTINIKESIKRISTELIGTLAFGSDYKGLKSECLSFEKYIKEIILSPTKIQIFKDTFEICLPKIEKILGDKFDLNFFSKSFASSVGNIVNSREKNNHQSVDFTQIFVNIMKQINQPIDKNITNDIARKIFHFFIAEGATVGFCRIYFTLYELSKCPKMQEKLQNEIVTVLEKNAGEITYESIQSMKYLQQVTDETLRKYPNLSFLTRRCVQDYKVPDENVTIKKGTTVLVPVLGIHYDEEYFPNPEKFDPERFNYENQISKDAATYLPFGRGPRGCPGNRLGLIILKFLLVSLLTNHKFTINTDKTVENLKVNTVPNNVVADGEIWLDVEKK